MIRQMDIVALTRPVPMHGLEAGDTGTVVMVHGGARDSRWSLSRC